MHVFFILHNACFLTFKGKNLEGFCFIISLQYLENLSAVRVPFNKNPKDRESSIKYKILQQPLCLATLIRNRIYQTRLTISTNQNNT